MKKTFLAALLAALLIPSMAFSGFSVEGESPVFTSADQGFLREMMKIQKRSGDVISGLGRDWGVESEDILLLPALSDQLSAAIRRLDGDEPAKSRVIAPDFSQGRAELLREAAALQVRADNIILGMVESESADRGRFGELRESMMRIAELLGELEN